MSNAFDRAFDFAIDVEGGYINDPQDSGGETKYGISKHAYPDEDIPNLTVERAKQLYRADYWDKIGGDVLPVPVALVLFDFAINSGASQAVKTLQRILNTNADGVFGSLTLYAVRTVPLRTLVAILSAERLVYLSKLPTWTRFARGWSKRVVQLAMEAIA